MTWLYADIGDLALKITAVGSPPGFEGIQPCIDGLQPSLDDLKSGLTSHMDYSTIK